MEAAGERLEAELGRILGTCMGAWEAASSLAALRPVTVYDAVNVAVWIKAVAKSPVCHSLPSFFIREHPNDILHGTCLHLCDNVLGACVR